MKTAEEIINSLPSVKSGIDDFYGRQTVIKVIKQAKKEAYYEGQSSPKIKQLEWDFYGLYYDVKTAVGHYMILQGDEQYFENHNTCTLTLNGNLMADFDGVGEAKAAAQSDFEKRVRECLE